MPCSIHIKNGLCAKSNDHENALQKVKTQKKPTELVAFSIIVAFAYYCSSTATPTRQGIPSGLNDMQNH